MEVAKQDRVKLGGKKSTNQNFDNKRKQPVRTSQTREPLGEHNPKGIQYQREEDSENSFNEESPRIGGADNVAKIQFLENELAEALEANNKYKIQLQSILIAQRRIV